MEGSSRCGQCSFVWGSGTGVCDCLAGNRWPVTPHWPVTLDVICRSLAGCRPVAALLPPPAPSGRAAIRPHLACKPVPTMSRPFGIEGLCETAIHRPPRTTFRMQARANHEQALSEARAAAQEADAALQRQLRKEAEGELAKARGGGEGGCFGEGGRGRFNSASGGGSRC